MVSAQNNWLSRPIRRLRPTWLAVAVIAIILFASAWAQTAAQLPAQSPTPAPAPAPSPSAARPAGLLLVAHPDLRDANFSRTVVLVTRTPADETIGVILNRRMADGSAAVPEDAKVREVFFGGPLAPRGLIALGAAPATGSAGSVPEQGAIEVVNGIHLVVGASRVRQLVQNAEPGRVRVFAGYAGWAPGQLENEIARGGWRALPATEEWLFDQAPESLWERLSARLRAVRCESCGDAVSALR